MKSYDNSILTNEARDYYAPTIQRMFALCPEMMSRKISEANVQQAFVYSRVNSVITGDPLDDDILCVGSFEDTACECLKAEGNVITEIDPDVNGMDLHTFFMAHQHRYDVIFSTSVIEHVIDDEQFIKEICQMLNHGGYAILTTDFNNDYVVGMPLPYTDIRFYTNYDLQVRLQKILKDNDCELVTPGRWEATPDFHYQGHDYSFATLVFRKIDV